MQYRITSYAEGVFQTYWFEKNLQGDIVAVYNDAGTLFATYTYDAWGGTVSLRYFNGGSGTAAQYNPFRYRGYYRDSETGFYYLNSRYYDPNTGRFINADGYVSTGQGLIGNNMYAYCNNSCTGLIDVHGELPVKGLCRNAMYTKSDERVAKLTYDQRWQLDNLNWLLEEGYSYFNTEMKAAEAWANQYRSQSKNNEYVAYIFGLEVLGGRVYYIGETKRGSSSNVISAVLEYEWEALNSKYRYSSISMIHSHPYPGIEYHNDFPSTGLFSGGGDEWAMFLYHYSEMYVVPYTFCSSTSSIIKYTDKTTWCPH